MENQLSSFWNANIPFILWKLLTPSNQDFLFNTDEDNKDWQFRNRAPRSLYVAEAGDVEIEDLAGNTLKLKSRKKGEILPFQPVKLLTGTDAVVYGLY